MRLGNHRSEQRIEKTGGEGNLAGDLAADLPSTEGGGGQGKKKKHRFTFTSTLRAHCLPVRLLRRYPTLITKCCSTLFRKGRPARSLHNCHLRQGYSVSTLASRKWGVSEESQRAIN
ncbi:hypothetical protein CEXT_182931 [Caerostris extrusa]|uniref:Uncharacterized protein n=1 Tax=Caerostris extrusa TaxID=172846 RepID=A0AAV4RTA3_CAEEX|nr:hypothetical protein CEXT_182931 [Caerostris extrusa]